LNRIFPLAKPVGLVDGVREMAAWAKKMGPREGASFSEIELGKNMPKVWRDRIAR
jgi:hypothetical protein